MGCVSKPTCQISKELNGLEKEVETYKQKQAEREAMLKQNSIPNEESSLEEYQYRQDFYEAINKYKTNIKNYEESNSNEETAYKKYQEDLKVYNKYLRESAEWKSKWG